MILKAIKNLFKGRSKAKALFEASVMLQKAIDEAEAKYKKTGHRYFVVYDPNSNKLVPITYDLYIYKTDSYIYLRRRGKFAKPLTREELKQRCFYYTASKNFRDRICPKQEKERRMLLWQKFYEMKIYKR
jgi:hypothetical protein